MPQNNFSLPEYLHSLVYFQAVDDAQVTALARHMQRHTFTPEETIFHENENAAGLWIIEHGRVKIFKINPDGEEHILHLLGPQNTFNDIAALDGSTNPANAAALSSVTLWLLPTDALQEALAHNSVLALNVIKILAGRVRNLVHQIEDLALYSVTIRLARFLLKQAEDPALSGPGITRAAIASHLATKPETISRALRTLEEAGTIQFDRHRIISARRFIACDCCPLILLQLDLDQGHPLCLALCCD
jgi:CRP/FNR family transcriptional regulator, dissimilatory nitrate respiration regulator